MIVKVLNNFDGYIVLDGVIDIDYTIKKVEKETKRKESIHPLENENHRYREIFFGGKKRYVDISIQQKNRCYRIVTDNTIYIMNDEGKTIERIY